MTFDPTTNRVPFGLLSQGEQKTLKEWPHGWEYWCPVNGWEEKKPTWNYGTILRGKPKPVVTSLWFNVYPAKVYGYPYKSREIANYYNAGQNRIAVLRIDTCNGVSTAHLEGVEK